MEKALDEAGLRAAYDARPPYQRNDYISWILRAVRPQTREKRLAEMLDDLRRGDRYMRMAWKPSGARRSSAPGGRGMTLVSATNRKAWRAWLKAHHRSAREAWLVYYKKGSGKPRVSYNDAVEEALCFGWIDSTVRTLDDRRFAQRFSPRRPGSAFSPANRERMAALIAAGRVIPAAREAFLALGPAKRAAVAPDILATIRKDKAAWAHFKTFSAAYKRIRLGFIEGARSRPAEFRKRLAHFIRMTAKGKMFGFGGIEKHY